MSLQLHDSFRRQTLPFAPFDPRRVTVYLCGPTVYNPVHIGNARGPVVFDVLLRLLRRIHPHVVFARNITDVDDKINTAAQAAGVPIGEITRRYTAVYHEDMAALGVVPPDVEPCATDHIGSIIAMIEKLIAGDHAYVAEGHVLFDVDSYPDYGRLSGRNVEELIAGARVEVAPYKRNPADFVLWKPSSPELPGWDSPWGRGRPGWHIECSAMSEAHLGDTIDIHAGGVDLLFPHHENEIAQSTCAHGGRTFARWWLHNGMLTFEGAKMSKSLGNIERVHDLLQRHPAEALRYALLSAHYRQPLEWSDALVEQSTRTLGRLYGTLRDLAGFEAQPQLPAAVETALHDDLNTPAALAAINAEATFARHILAHGRQPDGTFAENQRIELQNAKAHLLGGGLALGLLQQDPQAWFRHGVDGSVDAARIEALIAERQSARAAREFARADAIRDELAAAGVIIEDGAQGTRWSLAKR